MCIVEGPSMGQSASVKYFGLYTFVFPTHQCRRSRPKHRHKLIAQHPTYGNETWFQPLHTPIPLLRGQVWAQSAGVNYFELFVPNTSIQTFKTQIMPAWIFYVFFFLNIKLFPSNWNKSEKGKQLSERSIDLTEFDANSSTRIAADSVSESPPN